MEKIFYFLFENPNSFFFYKSQVGNAAILFFFFFFLERAWNCKSHFSFPKGAEIDQRTETEGDARWVNWKEKSIFFGPSGGCGRFNGGCGGDIHTAEPEHIFYDIPLSHTL